MARNITVYFADGSQHVYENVPDEVTPEQVTARANRDFGGRQIQHLDRSAATEPETTVNPLKGAVARGAELIGSGIETLGRAGEAIGDVIAEKLPFLDTRLMVDREGIRLERPTPEQIRTENQLQYMQDWADSFKNWGREINYEPSTQLGELADNPLKVVPFVVERVIASSPDMVAAATALPAYIPTRANEILNERLKNDNKSLSEATIGDVAAATGAAVVEGTLERFATRRLVTEGAEAATRAARIGKEAGVQAGTEAIEEVGAYAGETVGTQAGFDPRTAALTGLEAAIVGGGLGAGVQTGREVFGRRPEEAPPVTAPTEELAPELTPEALAPKEGRPARAAPIRARTLEELRGELPAAPVVEAEAVAAPPREPIQFERTKEPTPEAIEEVATFNEQFPEGGKEFNLFKARSIARKLGYEGVTNKTTRAEIEPLLRAAVAPPVEVPAPAPIEVAPPVEAPPVSIPAVEAVAPTVTPSIPVPTLPDFEVPEVAKLAYEIANVVSPPKPAPIEAPRMEVPRELPRTGVEQAVVGTAPRGIEVPLPRPVTAGPRVEGVELPRLAPIEPAPARAAERAEGVPPALEPIKGVSGAEAFSESEIKNYRVPEFKGKDRLVEMPIDDFLSLAERGYLESKQKNTDKLFKEGTKFNTLPSLHVYTTKEGTLQVEGHEGRHRARTLKNAGYETIPVVLKSNIRWSEQNDPSTFDYEANWPTALVSQDKKKTVPMPITREQAYLPYDTKSVIPEAVPSAPIFKSIESLVRPKPSFIDDLGRERAPSLRRELGKIKQDYDAGMMTGDQFAETTGNLLLKTQKERIVQPRQRGAEFIRERLFNASRNGYLDPQGVELASWFIQQNPLLVQDLGVSIRQQPQAMEGTAAFYEPTGRIVTMFKDTGDVQTATHEILHHTERLMPSDIRANILKAYVKQLTKAEKNAKTDAEKQFFSSITNYHYFKDGPEKDAEYQKAIDAIQNNQVPKSYYQYVNPSEFWAINGTRIVQGRFDVPPGVVAQIKKWLREFIEKAKSSLGLSSDAPIIRALDSLAKADGKYQTSSMLREAPGYRAIEPTRKPKIGQKEQSIVDIRRETNEKMSKPGVFRRAINKLASDEPIYEKVVENVQEQSRYIKKLQDDLRSSLRLVSIGDDKNNIYDQMSTAPNRAANIVAMEVEPVHKRLKKSIEDYMNYMKISVTDAVARLEAYRIAKHEFERRETLYLRNVPLNNTTREEFLPGEPAMTAADARKELEGRRSLAKDAKQAQALQDMIRYLAVNYADPRGYSPVKAKLQDAGKPTPEEMTTDFYDETYNVIGSRYTPAQLEAAREEFDNLKGKERDLVDQVMTDWTAVNELNKNLNRRANYWVDKVDRVIESYGWEWYVPFKGDPRAERTLDTDTQYLSGELSRVEESFNGRRTDFDSPLMQTLAESYFAASNAGRGTEVTTTIKNLIKLGVIKTKTKKPKIFSFEQRNSPDFDFSQVQGRDKIIHHNADGSIEVYSVLDPKVLEAIKTPYREMNEVVKIGNKLTSLMGQSFTRYNPSFAPMDFVRNSITNAFLISAREGGKTAREYAEVVAANVTRLGMLKAGNLSRLYANNDTAELTRLYNSGDPFYRDAMDLRKYGGNTLYSMAFDISDMTEQLQKELGPKGIIKGRGQKALDFMNKWVDSYNAAFEMTSRVAAYTVRKQQNIAEARKKKQNINDRKVMEDIEREAAAFALSLMNFRKIGRYGRELGAWFMFIRPAATGAVDAIDALRPGFFLKSEQVAKKAFSRLEPEIQELFDTQTLAEEVKRLEAAKKPNIEKIAELKKEIAKRQKAFNEFEKEQITRAKTARNTALFTIAAGAALYSMAAAVSGEDEEGRNRVTTDDMSRWTRYLRLPLLNGEGFLQIPWGFGVSALMSAGAQTAALFRGAQSFKDFAGNMVEIGIDSYLPIPASRINPTENFGAWLIDSVSPSLARPLVEFALNVDAMGNPIYNSRSGKYADAFTGSAKTSEWHRRVAEFIFNISDGEVSFQPDSVAFIMNNYLGAIDHVAENGWNLMLTATGDKELDVKKDLFVFRSFIGRNSNYDARKFAEAEDEILELAKKLNTFEEYGTIDQISRFYDKNPNADILIQIYNRGVNGELRRLRQERNEILRDRTLTPKERDMYIDDIRLNENYIKKGLVEDFEAYKGN